MQKALKLVVAAASIALVAAVCMASGATQGQPAHSAKSDGHHSIVRPRDLKWTPMQLPGAEIAVVSGDPAKAGEFVIRIKLADGTKVPPHWHPTDEHITVMRGVFAVGMGILYDESKLEDMQPAMYAHMPKGSRHFGLSKGESVVQVHGMGPFVVNWVTPASVPASK